ncbi:hypothetical protein Brsp05_04490 [Brucella sp. NBRC 12953]
MQILIEREGSCTKRDIAVLAIAIDRVEAIKATDGLVEIGQIKRCPTGNLHTARPKGMIGNAGLCGACFNIQPARETVIARKGRGSCATLEHFADARDGVRKADIVGAIKNESGVVKMGAGENNIGVDRSGRMTIAKLQGPGGDRRQTAILRIPGQDQRAVAGLVQSVLTGQNRVDCRTPGLAVVVEIADLNDRCIAIDLIKRDGVSGEMIAVRHENQAGGLQAAAICNGHGSRGAFEDRQSVIGPDRHDAAVFIGPIVGGGVPGSVTAIDRAIGCGIGAIPEVELHSGRMQQVDLMRGGGLNRPVGIARNPVDGAKQQAVAVQLAIILKDAIKTGGGLLGRIDIDDAI